VVLWGRESQANEARRRIGIILGRLGLTLHPEITRQVDLRRGKEGFVFLGCSIRKRRSIQRRPDRHYVQRWPSPRAMQAIRTRIKDHTDARRSGAAEVQAIIKELNPMLRGWANYFRTGNADRKFNKVDRYVLDRLKRWQWRRGGQRTRYRFDRWPRERFYALGLYKLQGTVRYPAQATERRSSESRVRENRTHGLKGAILSRSGSPEVR
jgi:hypothetical protein